MAERDIDQILAPNKFLHEYKGFNIESRPVDDIIMTMGRDKKTGICFAAEGRTEREGIKQIHTFIDTYRTKVPERLIIS